MVAKRALLTQIFICNTKHRIIKIIIIINTLFNVHRKGVLIFHLHVELQVDDFYGFSLAFVEFISFSIFCLQIMQTLEKEIVAKPNCQRWGLNNVLTSNKVTALDCKFWPKIIIIGRPIHRLSSIQHGRQYFQRERQCIQHKWQFSDNDLSASNEWVIVVNLNTAKILNYSQN